MTTLQTEVLVVGGGATGAGIAWDAALRGYDVILVDRADLAEGTSGRFHGLLHSGGRYVVKDPVAARECIEENQILRGVASATIEDTGGLFVTTPDDDPAYGDQFIAGCREAGVPVEEIDVADALRSEPRLNPGIRRAFTVPDGSIDVWQLVWGLANGAAARGARILPYHRATRLHRERDEVVGAELVDERTGETVRIDAGFTINAAGAWAHEVAEMAGIEGVSVVPGKGIMIAMNHRLVNTVVNRCTMPADGDILVPIRTVSVIGTTDIRSAHPDDLPVTQEEIDQMLDDGERLVPGLRDSRALRVWAGVRPLFDDKKAGGSTRDVSRGTALLDHEERDGVKRFITITGGKLTTYRLMAEEAVDAMAQQLGHDRPCTTKTSPLPGSEDGAYMLPGARLRVRDSHLRTEQLICECELIERSQLEGTMRARGTQNLDDIRRNLRLGMGPCQGGFCIPRATGILHALDRLTADEANQSLRSFLEERWKGVWPLLYGDQLRQARLDDWIFQGVLDVEHLPGDTRRDVAAAIDTGVRPGSAGNGDLQPTQATGSAHDATEGPA